MTARTTNYSDPVPKRVGIIYDPPTFVIEYTKRCVRDPNAHTRRNPPKKTFHRKIRVHVSASAHPQTVANKLVTKYTDLLGNGKVSFHQIVWLIRRIVDRIAFLSGDYYSSNRDAVSGSNTGCETDTHDRDDCSKQKKSTGQQDDEIKQDDAIRQEDTHFFHRNNNTDVCKKVKDTYSTEFSPSCSGEGKSDDFFVDTNQLTNETDSEAVVEVRDEETHSVVTNREIPTIIAHDDNRSEDVISGDKHHNVSNNNDNDDRIEEPEETIITNYFEAKHDEFEEAKMTKEVTTSFPTEIVVAKEVKDTQNESLHIEESPLNPMFNTETSSTNGEKASQNETKSPMLTNFMTSDTERKPPEQCRLLDEFSPEGGKSTTENNITSENEESDKQLKITPEAEEGGEGGDEQETYTADLSSEHCENEGNSLQSSLSAIPIYESNLPIVMINEEHVMKGGNTDDADDDANETESWASGSTLSIPSIGDEDDNATSAPPMDDSDALYAAISNGHAIKVGKDEDLDDDADGSGSWASDSSFSSPSVGIEHDNEAGELNTFSDPNFKSQTHKETSSYIASEPVETTILDEEAIKFGTKQKKEQQRPPPQSFPNALHHHQEQQSRSNLNGNKTSAHKRPLSPSSPPPLSPESIEKKTADKTSNTTKCEEEKHVLNLLQTVDLGKEEVSYNQPASADVVDIIDQPNYNAKNASINSNHETRNNPRSNATDDTSVNVFMEREPHTNDADTTSPSLIFSDTKRILPTVHEEEDKQVEEENQQQQSERKLGSERLTDNEKYGEDDILTLWLLDGDGEDKFDLQSLNDDEESIEEDLDESNDENRNSLLQQLNTKETQEVICEEEEIVSKKTTTNDIPDSNTIKNADDSIKVDEKESFEEELLENENCIHGKDTAKQLQHGSQQQKCLEETNTEGFKISSPIVLCLRQNDRANIEDGNLANANIPRTDTCSDTSQDGQTKQLGVSCTNNNTMFASKRFTNEKTDERNDERNDSNSFKSGDVDSFADDSFADDSFEEMSDADYEEQSSNMIEEEDMEIDDDIQEEILIEDYLDDDIESDGDDNDGYLAVIEKIVSATDNSNTPPQEEHQPQTSEIFDRQGNQVALHDRPPPKENMPVLSYSKQQEVNNDFVKHAIKEDIVKEDIIEEDIIEKNIVEEDLDNEDNDTRLTVTEEAIPTLSTWENTYISETQGAKKLLENISSNVSNSFRTSYKIDKSNVVVNDLLPSQKEKLSAFGDLNQVSERELKMVKQEMEQVFDIKRLKPEDDGYVFDKRVDFEEQDLESSWD